MVELELDGEFTLCDLAGDKRSDAGDKRIDVSGA
jgi:hypothetical protein